MILVTGATGKIGQEVVRLLGDAGAKARALLRDPQKGAAWKGIEVVRGDLDDAASIRAALQGVDTVLLITAANAKQELLVIEEAKRAGVRRIVKVSVADARRESRVALARGHAEVEEVLRRSGMAWTILRPGTFSQDFLRSAPFVKAEGRISASAGEGKVALIDARDIAAVAVKALLEQGHEGKTYHLTGPAAISYAEATAKLSAAIGKPIRYVEVTPAETRAELVRVGIPAAYADDIVVFQAAIAAGRSGEVTGDVEAVLGRPARSFDDFARDYAAAFR
jgi:uncharacterized protein YbjT (DUF2867 family)